MPDDHRQFLNDYFFSFEIHRLWYEVTKTLIDLLQQTPTQGGVGRSLASRQPRLNREDSAREDVNTLRCVAVQISN